MQNIKKKKILQIIVLITTMIMLIFSQQAKAENINMQIGLNAQERMTKQQLCFVASYGITQYRLLWSPEYPEEILNEMFNNAKECNIELLPIIALSENGLLKAPQNETELKQLENWIVFSKQKWDFKKWEIWNEPNAPFFYSKGKTLKENSLSFASMLEQTAKYFDKKDFVIMGGLATKSEKSFDPIKFLSYIPRQSLKNVDAVAYHPYGKNAEESNNKTQKMKKILNTRNKQLVVSEVGFVSKCEIFCFKNEQWQKKQTKKLLELYTKNKTNNVFLWSFRDNPYDNTISFDNNAGLWKKDQRPKPVATWLCFYLKKCQ